MIRPFPAARRRQAFTLIERFAVIAGMVATGFRAAMERAHSAKCANNLREIFTGMQGYLQDHNQRLMQRFNGGDGYDEALLPYVGNAPGIFTCPSQRENDYPDQPGYGLNWYYDNQSLFRVDEPSKTIFIAETFGGVAGSHRADRDSVGIGRIDKRRHNGVANYLFFDGHVAKLPYAATREVVSRATTAKGEEIAVDMWGYDYGAHSGPGN